MKIYSASFAVPAAAVKFWEDASTASPMAPFVAKCVGDASHHFSSNWEVKFSDGVVFGIVCSLENGVCRFIGEAWKLGSSVRDESPIFSTRPRKHLLGSYRIAIDGALYEVNLTKEKEG